MILVTGATGTIGSEVVRHLVAAGERPRVLVRDRAKARALGTDVEVHVGALEDPRALETSVAGVDRLFLLSAGLDGPALEGRAIEAARAAGVRHVVKLSVMGAEYEGITFARWHRTTERLLEASGLTWTFLRPGSFSSNALTWADTVRRDGAVYLPVGEGRSAVIDPSDVGEVAARILLSEGHEGKAYTLSGPTALSVQEQAGILGHRLGKSIQHVDVSLEVARAAMVGAGIPEAYVEGLLELHAATRAGLTGLTTPTVEALLGRPPRSFDDFVARHLDRWR